jgi:predicted ATP-grasp superfamily ATP-dependent carboligase
MRADAVKHLGFPLYIRPSESLRFGTQFRGKGFQANTLRELHQYLVVAKAHNIEVLLQEIIPGPTSHLYGIRGYLDQHSQLVAVMADQKIHQPSMFANNSVKRSIPRTVEGIPQTIQTLLTYLQRMKYTGLFHSEWKQDPRTNELKLLEINARSSGGNHFGAQCGMNHILMAYRDALGERLEIPTTYHVDVYQINLVSDLQVLLSKLTKSAWSGWSLKPYLQKKVWHTLAYDDPRPFLQQLRQTHARLMRRR